MDLVEVESVRVRRLRDAPRSRASGGVVRRSVCLSWSDPHLGQTVQARIDSPTCAPTGCSREIMRSWAVVAVAGLLTACPAAGGNASHPSSSAASRSVAPPATSASPPLEDERPTILTGSSSMALDRELSGRVLVRGGCLLIESHGAEWIPIWPSTYELIRSSTDAWLITDGGGGPVAGVGGRVTVLGGQVIVDMSIPPDCQRSQARFFAVTDVPPPSF